MSNDIYQFLPHRPPLVMIDSVMVDEEGIAHSTFEIVAYNVLVEDGHFSAAGLIENMAQTAGAAAGLKSYREGQGPGLGYIGAVKDLKVLHLPAVGQTLHTAVTFVYQVINALIVHGVVRCNDEVMAACELKIFLQP